MSLRNKLTKAAGSPQGRRLTDKLQKVARDPRTRERIKSARRKLGERRGRTGGGGPRAG